MTVLQYTSIDAIPKIIQETRDAFNAGKTRPVAFRKQQLRQFYKMMEENRQRFADALNADLRKHTVEGILTEVAMVNSDLAEALGHLDDWVKPTKPSVNAINLLDNCQIIPEPLGVVLIIGAWNYPVQLTLVPLVGAIAAGNAAIVKPSELSQHTAALLAELLPKYLDPSLYRVINGAVAETEAVLKEKFDHILYTGNGRVGSIVMQQAAKHLCPVTLELGGKSPVIVDEDIDINVTARRIVWGRFLNAGQTCIAADYILVMKKRQDALIEAIRATLREFYGEDAQKCPSYSRIVNANHFKRISALLSHGRVVIGGNTDEKDLYIEPTVIVDVDPKSDLMTQEIFGPILPIIGINSIQEAIDFVNARDKPLALYTFSNNKRVCQEVASKTSSGGFIANDCMMHATVDTLPFGGVGPSGMGAYHGKQTFDLFSHKKAAMFKSQGLEAVNSLRYPPYTDTKFKLIATALFKKPSSGPAIPVKTILIFFILALIYWRIRVAVPGFWAGLAAFFGL